MAVDAVVLEVPAAAAAALFEARHAHELDNFEVPRRFPLSRCEIQPGRALLAIEVRNVKRGGPSTAWPSLLPSGRTDHRDDCR